MIHDILHKLVDSQDLTRDEAADVMTLLMTGQATPSQVGALLIALRMKGETVEEVAGFAQAMRTCVVPVQTRRKPLLDTCGTGGSAFRVFNVSTAAAFVMAAAGMAVAKHGNRAMTGVCGSADVLEALGVRVTLTPEQCARCIEEVGIGFLFAQSHHPSMKHVGPTRREIGVRSVFNLLGPLTNPAGATRQTLGVYDRRLCALAIGALRDLGSERAIVMHGDIGLDEISTLGATHISELRDGKIEHYLLMPHDLGLCEREPRREDLAPRETPTANAQLLREVLGGAQASRGEQARQDLVAVNAAASLRVCGMAESWPDAVALARDILRSGKALQTLDALSALTQTF
jgi:anthranilate phosphoribosyltransferase